MRIIESYAYGPSSTARVGVPARARELLKRDSGFESDSVTGVAASTATAREERGAELRRMAQNGEYTVDVAEVSKRIIDWHLEK